MSLHHVPGYSGLAASQLAEERLGVKLDHLIYFLAVLYGLAAGGLVVYYLLTRCNYESLGACESDHEAKCGTIEVNGADDCERYVTQTEECFCSGCRYCLSAAHRSHCNRSRQERIAMCAEQMNKDAL
mmetsp:Transcript_187/g.461  ORF Transcript_187/g.461 Transcript_187/m.461 type:complete len:128 (+) Transcript_187:67-450(+)